MDLDKNPQSTTLIPWRPQGDPKKQKLFPNVLAFSEGEYDCIKTPKTFWRLVRASQYSIPPRRPWGTTGDPQDWGVAKESGVFSGWSDNPRKFLDIMI